MESIAKVILRKKVILWDFDGCFCDSEPMHYQAYAKAFAQYGHIINKSEYFDTFTHTGGGIAKEIKNHNLICNSEEIRTVKANYYWNLIKEGQAKLFPEIPQIILKLKQLNIKNVIASNSLKEEIEMILSHLEEKVHIEKIFGLVSGLRKKPSPDIFNLALSTLGFSPAEALVIEDSERGLLAARDAKCEAIWVKTYLTESFTSNAPYLDKITHKEFLDVLNEIVPNDMAKGELHVDG